jgi:hypothetical protein
MRLLLTAILLFCLHGAEAQYIRKYLAENKQEVMVYIGVGVQHGTSNRKGHILVGPEGNMIAQGDYKLHLNNHSEIAGMQVSTPVGDLRIGAGIEFERQLLYRVRIENNGQQRRHNFYEGYHSDKAFLMLSYPVVTDSYGFWELTPSIMAGAFWFSMLSNNTLFGFVEANAGPFTRIQGAISRKWDFMRISVMAYGDYRHFRNTSLNGASIRQHFINSGGLFGISILL